MKYEKKNLLVIAAAGLLSVMMMNGCGSKNATGTGTGTGTGAGTGGNTNTNTNPNTNPNTNTGPNKNTYEWSHVSVTADDKPDVTKIALSKDGKNIYAVVNDNHQLVTVASGDLTKPWTEIAFDATEGTKLADTAGLAKLATAVDIVTLRSTKEGVLVVRRVNPNDDDKDNGVVFVKGNVITAAWGAEGKHLKDKSWKTGFGTSLYPAPGIAADVGLNAAGAEIPLFFVQSQDPQDKASGIHGAANFVPGKANFWIGPAATTAIGNPGNFSSTPRVTATAEATYFVEKDQIRIVQAAEFTANDIHIKKAKNGTKNFGKVNDVAFVDGKLYIASDDGVYTYNPAADADNIEAPVAAWNGIPVVALAVDGKDVWAVADDGLWNMQHKVKLDAAKTFKNVTGAVVVNGDFVISTDGSGVHVATKK